MLRNIIAFGTINAVNHKSWNYMKKGKLLFDSSRKAILQYQEEQYHRLLLYAYDHTIYWHRIFDGIGLIKNGKIERELCEKIPILTKEIIRKEGRNLISDEAEKRGGYPNTSGGSTGEPVKFIQDNNYFSCNFGDKLLFGALNGKMPGDKEIKLWGSEKDILEGSIGIKEKCINWCYNRVFLNSFVMTPEIMKRYINSINREKPIQIWTYADSVYQLARYINHSREKVFSPKNIISTAGVLYDEMRTEISRAFKGSHIIDQYGSREVGGIGCEIGEQRGIRIFEHTNKVEILNQQNGTISDSGKGELLITNMTNYSMPLIRYRIGDMGEKSRDLTGYQGSFGVLTKLTGRTNTHLRKKDGSLIHGEYVTHLFYHKEWIENFKVIQHTYTKVEFQIVVKDGYKVNEKDVQMMKQNLKKVMDECEITIVYMDEIPKLQSGKYQFVVSEIDPFQ